MTTIVVFLILFMNVFDFSLQQPPDSPISIIAQSLGFQNDASTPNAENDTVTGKVGNFEKYHNATEPSFLYIVQLELKTSRVDEPYAEIEKRLDKLVEMAFALAGYKHRKQTPPAEITTSSLGYNTKILKKRSSGEFTYIHFVTYAGKEAILGEVVADDMTLLSKSQMSATLRYPLSKIISDRDIEIQSSTKLWFLIAIFGVGLILIALGWLCLFLFFNVCNFGYSTDQEKYLIKEPTEENKKTNDFNQKSVKVKPAAQQPNEALSSAGSSSAVVTTKKQQEGLNKTTYTESQPKLRKELDEEQTQIRNTKYYNHPDQPKRAVHAVSFPETIFDKPVGSENNKNAETGQSGVSTKSEKKRRHATKIGPITAATAITTTTTDERERETSEISRVSSPETTSKQEIGEFDGSNLPETSLRIEKKKKGNDDNSDDVNSEPESDYGSSLDDERSRDEETEFERSFDGEHHRVRPMTAKRHRTSLFGGVYMEFPDQPRAWTVYQAGDLVEEFWNNNRMYSHPTPGSPTDGGMVEMVSSSNTFDYHRYV